MGWSFTVQINTFNWLKTGKESRAFCLGQGQGRNGRGQAQGQSGWKPQLSVGGLWEWGMGAERACNSAWGPRRSRNHLQTSFLYFITSLQNNWWPIPELKCQSQPFSIHIASF